MVIRLIRGGVAMMAPFPSSRNSPAGQNEASTISLAAVDKGDDVTLRACQSTSRTLT